MSSSLTLTAAIKQRDDARAKHEADAAALQLGRSRIAASEAELARLADDDTAAVARHARRLEHQVREGKSGPLPALVPTEKHLTAERIAQRTLAAAKQMLESLESAERDSACALAEAESALHSAALAVLGEEADAMAAELMRERAAVERTTTLLQGLLEQRDFTPSRAVYTALGDRINGDPIAPLGGDWDRPIDELRGLRKPHDAVSAQQFWADRLAALMRGEGIAPDAPAHAA